MLKMFLTRSMDIRFWLIERNCAWLQQQQCIKPTLPQPFARGFCDALHATLQALLFATLTTKI